MTDWIFLSKNLEDEYINMFAQGCGVAPQDTNTFDYDSSTAPIVLRGIMKHKIMKQCWRDQRLFYYMDTGYFGNDPCDANPYGWKLWHRVVPNNLQHLDVKPCSDDRWRAHGIDPQPWKRDGSRIMLVLPDEKPCKFYDIDLDAWTQSTIDTIKKHTDREIVIRQRQANRKQRIRNQPLAAALQDDVFALVTFNSTAAITSVLNGIPVFTLAPCNAAAAVGLNDLSQIESPRYADADEVQAWLNYLAYGQFHVDELRDGSAARIIGSMT